MPRLGTAVGFEGVCAGTVRGLLKVLPLRGRLVRGAWGILDWLSGNDAGADFAVVEIGLVGSGGMLLSEAIH